MGYPGAFPGQSATPKTGPLAPWEFSLVTVDKVGVINEAARNQSGIAVSGLVGVLRVARHGGMSGQSAR